MLTLQNRYTKSPLDARRNGWSTAKAVNGLIHPFLLATLASLSTPATPKRTASPSTPAAPQRMASLSIPLASDTDLSEETLHLSASTGGPSLTVKKKVKNKHADGKKKKIKTKHR